MPIVKAPIQSTIRLNLPTSIDPSQEAYVEVRQATQREQEKRAALDYETTRTYRSKNDNEVDVKFRWTYPEQQRLEVFLTLAGCNIQMIDPRDAKGEKVIDMFDFKRDDQGRMRLNMTEAQFADLWGLLTDEWVTAIHKAVIEVNPQWNPEFRK